MNLSNLALTVSKLSETEGDDEIQRWARTLLSAKDTRTPPYPKGVHGLQLQFYPVGYFGAGEDDHYLTHVDLPGILTTVVVDAPDRLIAAPRSAMGRWADHEKDTFRQLIHKLSEHSPYPIDYLPLRYNKETVAIIASDSTTVATHALVLEKLYTELIGTYATLVGAPTSTTILAKPLGSEPSPELVSSFQEVVNFMAKGQPGYLSNGVYLYRNGAYTRVRNE